MLQLKPMILLFAVVISAERRQLKDLSNPMYTADMSCGSNGNNGGQELRRYIAHSSCRCAEECAQDKECVGWTFIHKGTFGHMGHNDCVLRSTWGGIVDDCGGRCLSEKSAFVSEWHAFPGVYCTDGYISQSESNTHEECEQQCIAEASCKSYLWRSSGTCHLRTLTSSDDCFASTAGYTMYISDDYQWIIRDNTNCYPTQNGADDHSCCARSTYTIETFESCQQLCIDTFGCNGITISDAAPRRCYLRHNIVLDNCVSNYPGFTSAKVTEPAYIKGKCTPSGTYTYSQCCPSGYVEVETLAECEEAFQQLGLAGILWGGNAPRDARPTGCFIHLQNNYMHFNPTTVYGNTMHGDDEPVCKLGSRSVYRVSNNGVTGWHPEVSEILVYADHVCTKPIQATFVEESGHIIPKNTNGFGDGSAAFDGDETTFWRPQCHYVGGGTGVNRCEANEAWVTFSTKEQVKCVKAHNLGVQRNRIGSGTSNGGILVELQLRDGTWTTAMESQSGNMAHGQPDLRSSGCSPPDESEKINVIRNCPQLDARGGIASCFNEGYTRYPSLEAAWDACAKIPECEYVQKYRYGYWYLRRFSDPIDGMIQGYGFNYDCEKARRKL